jgi:hypothetical protein
MSVFTTAANYGGRVVDNQQGIKQFYVSSTSVSWIYKKLKNNLSVITPADKTKPVLIDNDLIVTGSLFNTSDVNLKKNIEYITCEEAEKLLILNPIHYSYKYEKNNKKHYGLIAQDVEKIYPELVGTNELGFKTVNYQEFIPIMLRKIQLLQEEINELRER